MRKAKITNIQELNVKINVKQKEIASLRKQINTLESEVKQIMHQRDSIKRKIGISQHAVQRFRERILDIPVQKVKSLFMSDALVNKIIQHGDGKYVVPDYKNCVVVVADNVIVTCYERDTIEQRFDKLRMYMNYFVNQRAIQLQTNTGYIKPFSSFNTDHLIVS
jgi:septal ring factor EnvC (AmiA/AmiB activator)